MTGLLGLMYACYCCWLWCCCYRPTAHAQASGALPAGVAVKKTRGAVVLQQAYADLSPSFTPPMAYCSIS